MKKIFFTLICSLGPMLPAHAEDESLSSKLITVLWSNQEKTIKNACELGKSPKIKISRFLLEYTKWSISRSSKGRSDLKCEKSKAKTGDLDCELRFGEFDLGDASPGWDIILNFTYNEKSGIDWKTAACNEVP